MAALLVGTSAACSKLLRQAERLALRPASRQTDSEAAASLLAAQTLADQAVVDARRTTKSQPDLAAALLVSGLLLRLDLRAAEALPRLVQACPLHNRLKQFLGVVECLEGVAAVEAKTRPGFALLLFGAAASLREERNLPRLRLSARIYHADVAAARGLLSFVEASRAIADGASLTVDRAIALAGCTGTVAQRSKLTGAERTVAFLVAEGLTNLEIAQKLCISARTVQAHVSNALAKLGLSTRTALARAISPERQLPLGKAHIQ